ncbi:zinc finger protein 1035 [Mugil cephalus]|uniref:zinc finger protein 1035 n=1 Tax=Mugil cephalus TaxID=48193 RepID=UPI001FB68898|nr:zinc finger protein 1035 [Mugil cephalus]
MANGWESYFEDLTPLSSDLTALTTSESEETISQPLDNFIGNHDFSGAEATTPTLNFNTNYCSNPSIVNSSSDCVYQRICNDTQWHADGEPVEKDYLQKCGISEISDFSADESPTSGPFPSSFGTDLQGLKQDCGLQATSFLENFSDVSSCSDSNSGELRLSGKFMASNSPQKSTTDVPTEHSSSEWFFTHTGNLTLPTESLCSESVTETNVTLPSNMKAVENITECAQDGQMESLKETALSSTTLLMATTTESETVHNRNDCCQDQKQNGDMERNLLQSRSPDILSGHENLTGDSHEDEQISSAASNDYEQDHFDEQVLRKKTKELLNQETKGDNNPGSTDGQDGKSEAEQDKIEELKRKSEGPGSSENDIFEKCKSPIPNSTYCQGENMETNNQENDTQANTSHTSDPPAIQVCSSIDGTQDLQQCTSNIHDIESSVQLSEHQSYESVPQNYVCKSVAERSDSNLSDASASLSESCLLPNTSSNDIKSCFKMELTSPLETKTPTSSPVQDCSDFSATDDGLCLDTNEKQKNSVARHPEFDLKTDRSNTDILSCIGMETTTTPETKTPTSSPNQYCSGSHVTSDSLSFGTSVKSLASHPESCLQSDASNTDMHPCLEMEMTNADSSAAPEFVSHAVTSDSNSAFSSSKSCLEPKTSSKDINPCLEEEQSGQDTNTILSLNLQQPLDTNQVAQDQSGFSGDGVEVTRESFEDLDSTIKGQSVPGLLYGEPLSREDSLCDPDETKPVLSQNKETVVARPDIDNMDCSEGPSAQLKPSARMRKLLHPVVLLKTLESTNGKSNSYHCADCQHTTYNVDHLIEHHHGCHPMHNIRFCKTCNLYLTRNEEGVKHLCGIVKECPQLSSNSSQTKERNRHGRHRCSRCGVIFSKILHYIKHMRTHTGTTPFKCTECGLYFAQAGTMRRHKRIPGRCKKSTQPLENSDVVVDKSETPNDVVHIGAYANMSKCYVKLVDIFKMDLCGKGYTFEEYKKKLLSSMQKAKSVAVSSNQCIGKVNREEQNEIRGKYKCPLCPRRFKYSYNRARHLRHCVRKAIHGGKGKVGGKYQCPLCRATFTLSSNRYRHIKTSCFREAINRLAKENAKSRTNTDHQKTNENDQKPQSKENERRKQAPQALTAPTTVKHYKCNLCPAVYRHPSGKYRHMKKHESYKLTGKILKYRKSASTIMSKPKTSCSVETEEIKDKLKSTKANSSLTLSCRFCGKCFGSSQSLRKHERNHRGERPYRCLQCRKGFKRLCHLICHKAVHQSRIQCTVCRKILPTVEELIQHRNTHHQGGMLKCPDCHLQFQYPAQLLRHVNVHKNGNINAPQLEEKTPLKPQQTLKSVKERKGPEQLQCSLCKQVFSDPQILRKHCLTHISGNQCPFCKYIFGSRRYLLLHMVKHTGDKSFSCTNCGKQFYRDMYLKLHSQTCLPSQTRQHATVKSNTIPKRPYQCPYCPRTFGKKIRMKNHQHGHKRNSLLECSKCGQYFGITKLSQHQRNCGEISGCSTGISSPVGSFDKSPSQTSQNVQKMSLQSNATKMLKLKCPHCTQRFRYRSLLLRHLVSHTGLQPYPCMHCGHRFGSRTMCLQHEAFCDGVDKEKLSKPKSDASAEQSEKPKADGDIGYKCKFCTKTFMKPRNLRRHILTHNEVKPYRCKVCDCCFSRYDHLKVHQTRCKGIKGRLEVCIPKISLNDVGKGWKIRFGNKLTEKQKTFECEVCLKSFPSQSNLSRHFTLLHAAKLHKCTCGSSFSHEKSLKKHRKMKRCKRFSSETKASLPLGTNRSAENVTRPLDEPRIRMLERIQPSFAKKYKYVCSYCPRAFGNSWQLSVHLRLHTGERPYPCEYCGKRFIRKDYLQRHYLNCTKKLQSKVLCDGCGGFFSIDNLEEHNKSCTLRPKSAVSTVCQDEPSTSQSPPKGFSCAYCSSRFLLFSQLQEHFLSAHKLETMVPPVSTAPLQQLLSNIPNIKEEPLDESCDVADATKLDTGLESEVSKKYFCPDCDMSFATKAGLTGHLRVHAVAHPFKCKICSKGFWNKSLLRNHHRRCRNGHIVTQPLEVPLKAEIDFALNESVLVFKESSKTTGTGVLQTNFSCKDDLMDKSPQNSEENQVQSSSTKEKKPVQYQCSECDKSFTDGLMLISHLEDHGRQEQEKKRNTCTKCGRVCSTQGSLEKHMRIHGDKTYTCPNCSKVFNTISELEVHKAFHDPSRPFACKLCTQRFWTRPALCSHYKESHANSAFSCQFCSKVYATKKSLSRHYKKWHQKEQKEVGSAVQKKSGSEQQSSSQVSTTGESGEDEDNGSKGSDSDSAPYFPCHVCGKTFTTSESLEDHQLCHLGEKPHECAECGRCFFQAAQLQQHQRMHKSEFQCQMCGRGFVSLFALRKHKHTHGKSRPHRCSKCHLSFTGPAQLAEHMSAHREENFPCDICNRVFPSKSSRAEHRKSHSKLGDPPPPSVSREHERSTPPSENSYACRTELKYRCGVCNDCFRDPEELSEHGCKAAKERPYSCADCNKHFLHASHLQKHSSTHHPSYSKGEYSCNQCSTTFLSSQSFLSHLKSHVDSAPKIKHGKGNIICPVCHKYFARATELIGHFPIHIETMKDNSGSNHVKHKQPKSTPSATKYECKKCGQSYLSHDAFRQHHCSHQQQAIVETKQSNQSSGPSYHQATAEEEEVDVTGEDFFNCPVCSMQFSSKSGLLDHQNTQHPSGRPFSCDFCGKTFAKKKYLREHERRHRLKETANNDFKCSHCRARFSTSPDLSLHMRLHAEKEVGEYRCDMCYKSFSHWSHLKQHQESHVGEVVYECTECDKAFAFPHLLEEHQQTHAGSSQ